MPNPIRVATLLDATSTVEAFVVQVDHVAVAGDEPRVDHVVSMLPDAHSATLLRSHERLIDSTVIGGFVHVDYLPLFGSVDPGKLREIAAGCIDLADRLDAARTVGAGR